MRPEEKELVRTLNNIVFSCTFLSLSIFCEKNTASNMETLCRR